MEEHLFWIASRAAGIAALLLSSAAVGVGLTMGGRLVKGRGVDLRAAHEALSLATLIAIVIHAVTLLGDSYLNASVLDIAVPFVSGYKEPWMSIGIVCRLGAAPARRLVLLPRRGSASRAGRSCTAGPRWRGSPASCTRSARAPTPAPPGSSLHRDRGRPSARPPRRPPSPVHPRPRPHMSPTLAARRARVARIRRTVTAVTVAVFVALFATIYIQMAAGKDPALGTSVTTAQVSTTSSSSDDRPPERRNDPSSSEDTTSSSDDSSTSSDDSVRPRRRRSPRSRSLQGMKTLYTRGRTANENGRTGHTRTDDGKVDFDLSAPKELGGDGGPGTNPEQLFAAGYAACFANAMRSSAQREGSLEDVDGVTVTAHVDFGALGKGRFGLGVRLVVDVPALDQAAARTSSPAPTTAALLQRDARQHRARARGDRRR